MALSSFWRLFPFLVFNNSSLNYFYSRLGVFGVYFIMAFHNNQDFWRFINIMLFFYSKLKNT
ncbi:hypothetical protein Hdeb2414_s0002g00055281 [Helianthus debilis subsp. tardiflorus]